MNQTIKRYLTTLLLLCVFNTAYNYSQYDLDRLKKNKKTLYWANLNHAPLSMEVLSNVNLGRANLFHANLYKANLYNVSLNNADLRGVDFRKAKLLQVSFYGAKVAGANFEKATCLSNFKKHYLRKHGAINVPPCTPNEIYENLDLWERCKISQMRTDKVIKEICKFIFSLPSRICQRGAQSSED